MCVWSDRFGVYFFTKRVRILMKVFKTSMSFVFTFSRLQCLQSLHLQDFNVFSLYISRLQCLQSLPFKTSMSSIITFSRPQYLQSLHLQDFNVLCLLHFKTSMSPIFVMQDYNVCCLILLILPCRYPFVLFFLHVSLPWFSLLVGQITWSLKWN